MKYLLLILLGFLCSCATPKKAAIKLTEQGLHEAALEKWVEAFRVSPDDHEVQVGLKMCQEKVSNDRLVRIRDLRSAREEELALDEMKKLIDLQSVHAIQLDYNSSGFQGREVEALWKYQKLQLINLIDQKKPLAAEVRYLKFSGVFDSFAEAKLTKELVRKAGARQCKSLMKEAQNKPFYQSFSQQFCKYFDPNRKLKATPALIQTDLFAEPQITVTLENADPFMNSHLAGFMKKGFEKSPWFHPESKKSLVLKVGGRYTWNETTRHIPQSQTYTEDEPYTAYESVMKTRQVPYSTVRVDCSQSPCEHVPVTEYRTDTYWESEPVTRYREVTRTFDYLARKKTIEFEIAATGSVVIGNKSIPFSFAKQDRDEAILHDMNMPEIGLTPATKDVMRPTQKFENYSELLEIELLTALNSEWIKQFCTLPQGRELATMGENVMKCRRTSSYPVTFVDTWFVNVFGVASHEAEAVIGKF